MSLQCRPSECLHKHMKRVLVTGATGFIGRNTLMLLASKGYEVHAVSSKKLEATYDVQWHCTNLLDSQETERLMAVIQPTHLLHLAWYVEPGKFWHSPENFHWLESSIALLRSFKKWGGHRTVMAGTCAEYDWNFGYCSEAITPCRPATAYGICKKSLQEVLHAYGLAENLSSAWGRIFFIYGPNEHSSRLVASVITSLLCGETARCTHGNQVRDFLHVEDAASAFVALLDSEVEGVVNIASGRPVTLRQIVCAVAECLGSSDFVQFGDILAPVNEPPLLLADIRRLTDEVRWCPRYDLKTGIEQTVGWWKSEAERGDQKI